MIITDDQAKAIRRKQADKQLLDRDAAKEIGISQATWRKIRGGGYNVKTVVYQKAMEWLAKDY